MDSVVKITRQHLTVSRKESEVEGYLSRGWTRVKPLEVKKPKKKKIED